LGRDRLAARRRELGLSQEQLAYALGHDPTTIGRWERAETTPQPLHRAPLAKALDITLPELNSLLTREPALTPAPAQDPLGTATELRLTTRQIIDLDTRHGGDDLLALATRSFRTGHSRLAATPDDHELGSAVAEAGQVAAWVAYDTDRQQLSRSLHEEAVFVARLAGDCGMELFLLSSLAMQATYVGNGREALRIADNALERHNLRGRTATLFHARRARALALAGDRPRALGTLARARADFAEGPRPSDPPWTWWITEAELTWHEAMILTATDDWPAGIDAFATTTSLTDRALRRSHYNSTAHLWTALAAAGAWQDAEPLAIDLATRLDDVRSGRTRTILRRAIAYVDQARHVPTTLADATARLRRSLAKPS
jgi:transcriptional regulator with XRE-family HTH domain